MMSDKKHPEQPEDKRPEENEELQPEAQEQSEEQPQSEEALEPDLQTERDDLLARLQRLSADYRNYQKRTQRDLDQARQYANEDIIKALLPVIDDMERTLEAARENHGEDDALYQGMEIVHRHALQTLQRFGVNAIDADGKEFDPEMHTAMMQQPSDEVDPGTVLRVLQKGYRLKDRTVRPAAVIVSKAPDEEAASEEENEQE